MRKLKILHTVEFYAPDVGGAQLVVQKISEWLAAQGHDVTVATTKLVARNFSELNGVKIKEFEISGNFANGMEGTDRKAYLDYVSSFDGDVMMNYAAQQWATDIAFHSVMKGQGAKVKVLCPCGYSAMATVDRLAHEEYTDYYARFLPAALLGYDAAVYHSSRYKDYEFGQKLGAKNSVVIPNAVHLPEFQNREDIDFRAKYGINTKHMLLSVGSFAVFKGQSNLIRALIKMAREDVTLVLIGSNHGTLQELVAESLGSKVKFLVDIPRKDTIAAFFNADLFVFGSEVEASPLVILEAGAAKLPFVSTNCGNVQECKGGIVCEKEDLSVHIANLLADPKMREDLAREGYEQVTKNHSWESVCKQYESLYYSLLEKKSAPAGVDKVACNHNAS